MSNAEKLISDCTRNCSNKLDYVGTTCIMYQSWLTPDQARKAVEIAREEVINYIRAEVTIFLEGAHEYTDDKKLQMQYDNEGLIRDFRALIYDIEQKMKDEVS